MKRLLLLSVLALAGGAFTGLAQSPPALLVDVTTNSRVRLSWTNTPGNIVLEETDTLTPPGVWRQFPQSPTLLNGQFSVVVEATRVSRFFRLHKIETGGLPPDPASVASPIPQGVATPLGGATEFLYTGPNPIQTGVTNGTIQPQRAAVVRGKVKQRDNTPLSGVTISILNHPELGQTLSRADGVFDMAVNGGGLLTIIYEKASFLPVQRQVNVPWQDYAVAPDVVMMQRDTQVTTVDLTAAVPMQAARGSQVSDTDGTRRATVLIPQGTQAQVLQPGGGTQAVSTLHIRLTEYTVGANGPSAMPGPLPPTSGYTYAVELSADEAVTKIGGKDVLFSQPVFFYVENFLNFPAGVIVPVGFYDQDKAAWIPSDNGRVIKILGVTGGLAALDTDGDGVADNGAGLGITPAERQQLASLYQTGQSLWRVPISHFSTLDGNWPFKEPADAKAPNQPPTKSDETIDEDPCEEKGSIIEAQNQILGEIVGVVGTPFTLNYRSDRVPGRTAAKTLSIQLSGASVPASLKRIELGIQVGGRTFSQSFPAGANQSTTFTWDGQDAYGRTLQGSQPITGSIGYVYDGVYQQPQQPGTSGPAFGLFGGAAITGDRARQEITISQPFASSIGGVWDARGQSLGAWTLSVHHAYDPARRVLYLGNGRRQSGVNLNGITTVAGTGTQGFNGDGGPATQAQLAFPRGVALGPDGRLYIADDTNRRIRRVSPDGIITTVAGTGTQGFSGDGGPASQARLNGPQGVALGPDGSLYIPDINNQRIRRVAPDGIITTVAGTGTQGFNGDGGPATQAQLRLPAGVALGPDGSLYIADAVNQRIRRVAPDGIITTVAGTGTQGFSGDGGPATQAQLGLPDGVALGPDGRLYIADRANQRIRRVAPDGIITTVAGTGTQGFNGDGGLATQARLDGPQGGVALGPDGSLYIPDQSNYRIRRVAPDGIITTVAGTGTRGFSGDGGSANQAQLNDPEGVALGPDGSLYIVDFRNHRIRRVAPPLPGFSGSDMVVASEDGGLLHQFDAFGRHLRTLDTLTGATLLEFGYDADGRLTQVIEKTGGTNNVTTIQHDGNGNPTAIISPFGQATTLAVDANGFLSRIVNPAAETNQITYTTGGLLTSFTDAKGKTATYQYDSLGRLLMASDSCCGTQTFARTNSPSSTVVTRTTALGRTTSYAVHSLSNGNQRLVNTFPDGTKSTLELRQDGTRIASSPDGTVSTALLGPDPRFGMAAAVVQSNVVSLPSGLALINANTYRAVLTNAADPLSLVSLTETTTVNGRTATNTYTAATRTFVNTTPVGRTETHVLDALGRVVRGQLGNLDPVHMEYDNRGRVESMSVGSGLNLRRVSYSYNAQGFLERGTDPIGRTHHLTQDAVGRVKTNTLPDGRVVSLGYDLAGNLTSVTPPGRPAHTFGYSDRNELIIITPPSVPGTGPTTFAYDVDRAITKVSRGGVQTIAFSYDATGRLVTRTLTTDGSPSTTDTLSYDVAGRITNVVATSGVSIGYTYDGAALLAESWSGPVTGSVTRTYDASTRLGTQSVNGTGTIAFSYDNDGFLTGAGSLTIARHPQHALPTVRTLGVLSDNRTYNGFGEVTNFTSSASGSPLYSAGVSRDALGRVVRKVEMVGGVTDTYIYSYDTLGQLTGVTKNGVAIESYAYDANGNRTNATVGGSTVNATYDHQDRLMQYGSATFTYNAAGDLVSKANGAQATTYKYDALGNLLGVTLPDATAITYLVDARGRRVAKRVNGMLVQGFLYGDALRPVAKLNGSGAVVSRFVYAGGVVPAYLIKGGVAFRLIRDQVGSVRLVVNTVTGAIVQRIDYDSFGNVLADTNPGFQPFGFASGLYDPDTKLVRFVQRDYDTASGRWTAKDPIGFASGDSNLYRYVRNDPINIADPLGLADPYAIVLKSELLLAEIEAEIAFLDTLTGNLGRQTGAVFVENALVSGNVDPSVLARLQELQRLRNTLSLAKALATNLAAAVAIFGTAQEITDLINKSGCPGSFDRFVTLLGKRAGGAFLPAAMHIRLGEAFLNGEIQDSGDFLNLYLSTTKQLLGF